MRRPHLVLFNVDQWRGDCVGHLGHPAARTPVLDACAATDFVSFRRAYCQNPVCTPSRCSFMTGWYPHVRGHRTMYHMLHPERGEPCLLEILRREGWHVAWGGKNDLVPGQDGYDRYCDVRFRGRPTRPNLHVEDAWRGPKGGDNFYSFFAGRLEAPPDEDGYLDSDEVDVRAAVDHIDAWDDPDRPMALYLALSYPHPPYGVEEPWFSAIDRAALPPRPTLESWEGKPALLRGIAERQGLEGWTEDRWDELRATYLGMAMRVDAQFGRVLDALRRRGLYDDALIVFFSDHGDYTGDYGLVEKTQNTFEDCLSRVPLLVKPPAGVPCVPRVTPAMAELIDVPATVYDLLGIEPGYDHFGRSLRPVLAGADDHRDAVFCEGGRRRGETQAKEMGSASHLSDDGLYWPRVGLQQPDDPLFHNQATMCRTERYKYVARDGEPDEFYDLEADPHETRNLIDDPALAGEVARHRERLMRWFQATADVVPYDEDRRW